MVTSHSRGDILASRSSSGSKALERAKVTGSVPYSQPANQSFYEAGRGLVESLMGLQMMPKAIELVRKLVQFDTSDPLELRALVDAAQTGGLPIVELKPPTRDS